MPVEDPVFYGDQVRHDGFGTFYEFVNFCAFAALREILTYYETIK